MYYIYHIKGVKWGMTNNLQKRLSEQGYKSADEVIEEEDLDKGADLEKELNIKYGYPWNDTQDYRVIYHLDRSIGGRASATKQWKYNRTGELEKCKKGGESARDMGVGFHSLTKEELSAAGLKGYLKGLGSLPKEKRLEFLQKANKARMEKRQFSKEDVLYIRKVFTPRHEEYGCVALAKKYNTTDQAIRNVVKGRTYKDY